MGKKIKHKNIKKTDNLMNNSDKRDRFELWNDAYSNVFSELAKNLYLHENPSPYYDINSIKNEEITNITNLLKNSTAEMNKKELYNKIFNRFKNYKEKTLGLTLFYGFSVKQLEQLELQEIYNANTLQLIKLLNKYYTEYNLNKKTGKLKLTYTEGYASPENNIKDSHSKTIIENTLNKWLFMVYKTENDFSFGSVKQALESISSGISITNEDELKKILNDYYIQIKNDLIKSKTPKVIKEAILNYIKNKNIVIINAFSTIKNNKPNKKKDKKKKTDVETFHYKFSTSQRDYVSIYKDLGLLYDAKQLGNEVEKDVFNALGGENGIFIKINDKEIKAQAHHLGASKLNSKTRTTDIDLITPSLTIKKDKNNNLSVQIDENKQVLNNFSYKNSTPNEEISTGVNEMYGTHLRTMDGLDNALTYLKSGLSKIKGVNLDNTKKIMNQGKDNTLLKYFFVNAYGGFDDEDFEFKTILTHFLGSAGEFFQFAVGQQNKTINDQIDFMVINHKIIPTGYLLQYIFEQIQQNSNNYNVQIALYKKAKGKKDNNNVLSDSWGSFYEKPTRKGIGKNLMSSLKIKITMTTEYRKYYENILNSIE